MQDVRHPHDCLLTGNKVSSWTEFMPEIASVTNNNSSEESDGACFKYTFERPIKKRKYSKRITNCMKNNDAEIENHVEHSKTPLISDNTCSYLNNSKVEPIANSSMNEKSKYLARNNKECDLVPNQNHNIMTSRWSKFVSTHNTDSLKLQSNSEDLNQSCTQLQYNKAVNAEFKNSIKFNYDKDETQNTYHENAVANANNPNVDDRLVRVTENSLYCKNKDAILDLKNEYKKSEHLDRPNDLATSNINFESKKEIKISNWGIFMKEGDDTTVLDFDQVDEKFSTEKSECLEIRNVTHASSAKDETLEKQTAVRNEKDQSIALGLEQNSDESNSSESPHICENDNLKLKNGIFSFNTQNSDLDSIFAL